MTGGTNIAALTTALAAAEVKASRAEAKATEAEARAAVAAAKVSDAEAEIAFLKLTIEKLRREFFGQRSERKQRLLDQLELQLDELEASATEDELAAEKAAAETTEVKGFTRRRTGRKPLPAHLPRERVVVPPPAACACCGSAKLSKIGEDITETLEAVPRQWKVIQTVREKFTCRRCEKISQPPAPFHPTPRGWAGPKCPKDTRHRQVKYLNNVIEADHGKLKLLIRPVRGFKTLKTAYATIKGFEVMRALRKGQAGMTLRPPGRHRRRGPDRRARLRSRTVRSDRGGGVATGPSGQRRNMTKARLSS